MKKTHIVVILLFVVQLGFLPLFLQKNDMNSPLIAISNDKQVNTLGLTDMYPSQFENSLIKIYELKKTFTFTFSSTQMTYGIYVAAKFVYKDFQSVYLVIYVFVNTLTDYYVSNLAATFNFDLTCTYSGITMEGSGSPSDSSSMFQFGPELYEYYLHNSTLLKNLLASSLSITIDYQYTSSEFNEIGTISSSALLPAMADEDFMLFIIFLVLMIVIGASAGIIVFIVKRRRNRDPYDLPKLNKSRYDRVDERPIDITNMDEKIYTMLKNMNITSIIDFLKDNRKEVKDALSKREITRWIQYLHNYPQSNLTDLDCQKLALDFNNW